VRFCPKCGSLMIPRRSGDKHVLACLRCGYEEEVSEESSVGYSIRTRVTHTNKEKTVILDEKVKIPKVAPTVKSVECPHCGHNEAYYWIVQTRAADEPPTRIYKCTKCGYSWREYE